MSFELPGWVEPILNLYGVPWPDVDEDAFHWVQQPLRDFGRDVVAMSEAIESAISDLQAGNPSQTLASLNRYCAEIRREFLDPIQSVCDGLAGEPCDIAYQAILGVKIGLVTLLSAEIGEDAFSIIETVGTLGIGAGAAAAQDLAIDLAVREAIQFGEDEVVSQLQAIANRHLDNFVNSLINPFIYSVERTVENRVDSYLPQLVLGDAMAAAELDGSAARRLHLNPEQLNHAVTNIRNSSQNLKGAASKLDKAIDEIFYKPDPNAPRIPNLSSSMRMALMSVVKTVKGDLVSGIETLVQHVEQHFVTLLEDFVRSLEELDADTRRAAAAERMAAAPEVVVLSAAATWVGASRVVDPTSGRVDATEVDRVQAAEAEGVDFAASVDTERGVASSRQPGIDVSVEAQSTGVENPGGRADPLGPGVTQADKGVGPAEELRAGVDQSSPHVGMAQAPGGTVQGTGSHRNDQHATQVGVAESHAATGVQHLHAEHSPHVPAATTAEGGPPRTEEVGTANAGPESDAQQ